MHDLEDTGVALDLVAPVVLTESVEYHLTGTALRRPEAADGARWDRSARPSPASPTSRSSFRGHYLENHDLEALGFLVAWLSLGDTGRLTTARIA